MKERLDQLRILTRALEPALETRRHWTDRVNTHAQDLLESLSTSPAFQSTQGEGKGIFNSPLTEEPEEPEVLLKLLAEHVEKPGVKLGSPVSSHSFR